MFSKGFKKIKRSEKEIELQEVFLDRLAQKKEEEIGASGRKFEVPLSRRKLKAFYFVFLIITVFLFGKTLYMQTMKEEEYSKTAEANCHKLHLLTPVRGVVYDQSMNQLVFNELSFDLVVNKKELPESLEERDKLLSWVAELIKEDSLELKKKVEESEFNTVLLKENLEHEYLVLLETKMKDLPEFEIEKSTVRDYKEAQTFSHLLGYTGKIGSEEIKDQEEYLITDYIGKRGLEKSYEETLRGKPGKVLIERNALGERMFEKVIMEPESGESLVLWLDYDLQKKLQEALLASMERVDSKKGVAIAMNPNTGGILAFVSIPSFDNNLFSKGISSKDFQEIMGDPNQPLFNRALAGGYPVGSIIKPLMATAALEEELISPDKGILCEGGISIPNPYFPDQPSIYLDWKTHGWTDLRKAIAESCNVYFYTIGGGYKNMEGLGVERIKKYLNLFGWGQKTGIDLPGEISGRIPDPEWRENYFNNPQQKIWRIGDTYNLSIGQGDILTTPLQVVTAFSAIANGGTLYRPQVVKEITKRSIESAKIVKKMEPEITREDFVDSGNLKIIKEGMREAVEYGSSIALKDLPVKAGSKTGTAQTPIEELYHNWVTVIAPIEDSEIVLTIIIENVEGMQFAALPVARDTLNWYFGEK